MLSINFLLAGMSLLAGVDATARGLAWATDNAFAPVIGSKPQITWYHHWEDGIVPQMPSKNEFVPMFWGPSKWGLWNSRKAEMNIKGNWPTHLMGFNEPDVPSQSNMDPNYAAQVWMSEIQPYGSKGVKLISPAVAWNLDWTATFLAAVQKSGGNVDMIAVHWYGSYQDIASFKKYIATARSRFNRKIWVTELGVTTASGATQAQTKQFMMDAFAFMQSTGYVDRASWFGCFESSKPPDNYATAHNALFVTGGTLNDMGYWYGYTANPDRREESALRSRHAALAQRIANRTDGNGTVEEGSTATDYPSFAGDVEHCDATCVLRNKLLDGYSDEFPPNINPDEE